MLSDDEKGAGRPQPLTDAINELLKKIVHSPSCNSAFVTIDEASNVWETLTTPDDDLFDVRITDSDRDWMRTMRIKP